MRSTSIAAVAAISTLALTSLASAADLPRKAVMPVVAPNLGWTGWYGGINAGVHCFANDSLNVQSVGTFNGGGGNPAIMNLGANGATVGLTSDDSCGFIGGGQLGYNWQAGSYVYGVETDIQGVAGNSNFNATTILTSPAGDPFITHIDASKRVDWLGTLRGRIGWLWTPTTLLYATGGLAYGGVKSDITILQTNTSAPTTGATAASFSDTRVGWTLGAGVEWAFVPGRWTAKLEYLYYDLGDVAYNAGVLNGNFTGGVTRYAITSDVNTRFDGHIGRLGVNYRF